MTIEYPGTYDTRPQHLRADWALDTPAGPVPLTAGNVTIDRTWTPTLNGSIECSSSEALLAELLPMSTEPLYLRLRTHYEHGPQLDLKRPNLITNSSFESAVAPWTTTSSARTTVSRSTEWAAVGDYSLKAVCTSGGSGAGDARIGDAGSFPFGLEPGKTYTLSGTLYLPEAYEGAVDSGSSRQRRIIVGTSRNSSTYTLNHGPQAPNEAGEHHVSVEFTVPQDGTGVVIMLGCAGSGSDPEFVTHWDALMLAEHTAGETQPEWEAGTLGEYEWPVWDGLQKVDQVAWQVYPRSIRTDRVTGFTTIEVASGEILLYEQRNASGGVWRPRPDSFSESPRRQHFRLERVINQAVMFAGIPATVDEAYGLNFTEENTPEWVEGDSVWSFFQSMLRDQWTVMFNPVLNTLIARSSVGGVPAYDPVTSTYLIASTITEGDSTELGVLDFYDGLIINWTWPGSDGSSHRQQSVHVAEHLDSWRDVTKWRELNLNSSPQVARGDHLIKGVARRVQQGTHTIAIHPWSIVDLGLKWRYPISRERLAFSIEGASISFTSPLPEEAA